jgi:uncharacterized protein (DUF58 family)
LFLLASWIAALIVGAGFYTVWNWRGLRARISVHGTEPGPDSPLEGLSEQLLRSGPIPAPIFEGDRLELELGIETSGASRGPARLTGFIAATPLDVATGLVPRAGWKERRMVGPLRRGPVDARTWVLEASDPMGMYRYRRRSPDAEVALVLPRFTSLVAQPEVRELEASIAAPRAGSGTEMFGVREYRPGDPLRRIHWRSSARHGELVVREYEPPGVQTLGIFCDPTPATPEIADQIARLAASEAWDCIHEGGRVILWAPGQEPSRPSEARSFWALLEWLSRYPTAGTPEPAPTQVSDAVGVTAGDATAVIEALETVRHRGGRIRAWVVGEAKVDLEAPVRQVGTDWPL